MTKGSASGHSLRTADIPVVLGMAGLGDRNHDIAAWFGVNQGRIAEAKSGDYGNPPVAPPQQLPPSGAPGIKGRCLRDVSEKLLAILEDTSVSDIDARSDLKSRLAKAIAKFDEDEG